MNNQINKAYFQLNNDYLEKLKKIESKKIFHLLKRKGSLSKTIAVDLTPIIIGGDNGGLKIFALELIKEVAKLMPHWNFILLTTDQNHQELVSIKSKNIMLRCVIQTETLHQKFKPFYFLKFQKILKQLAYSVLKKVSSKIFSHPNLFDYPSIADHIDLLFCPFKYSIFHKDEIPMLCVIADIQYQFYPQFFVDEDLAHREFTFKKACEKASHIITISDYSKKTIVANSPYAIQNNIESIYIGLDYRLPKFSSHLQNRLFQKFSLTKENYLLYPANYWQHKNHEVLFTGFTMYLEQFPNSNLMLACTGAPSERSEYLQTLVIKMNIENKVKFLGYLSNEAFSAVFTGCKAIIIPSLFEGFGMPILEAMANAKPVLCSNVTCLPEIASDSAIYFDPKNPTEIMTAIQTLETFPSTIQRNIEYGLQRAKEIGDITLTAKKYLTVMENTIKNFSPQQIIDRQFNKNNIETKSCILKANDF